MKFKTEQEAWLALAEIWKGAVVDPESGKPLVTFPDGSKCLCLCTCLACMSYADEITDLTKTDMEAKIQAVVGPRFSCHPLVHIFCYVFPLTPDGAKQRVQYCLDRAEELSGFPPQ